MFYLVQENTFRERHYDLLIDMLDRYGFPYEVVRIFPFVDRVVAVRDVPDGPYDLDEVPEFVPPTDEVFVFGAVKLSRICAERGWKPGSLLNDNHDFEVYGARYGESMLNHDSLVVRVGDDFQWGPGEVKFIRPTRDTKSFTGALFTEAEWAERRDHNLRNFRGDSFNEDTPIQVSSPKAIYKEMRFWVVGGRVVTGSTYRVGSNVVYSREMVDPGAWEFAQSMVDEFRLADAFVIDVCDAGGCWRVVECGCINSAGFYDADLGKLLGEIDKFFGNDEGD